MTVAEKALLFGKLFALLGSPQEGERTAALEKFVSLSTKMGWPSFADILQKMNSTVTPQQLEAVETELARCRQAHDVLARTNAALTTRNAALRTALVVTINWGRMAAITAVMVLGYSGWQWLSADPAAASPIASAEDAAESPAVSAALRELLSRTKWGQGEVAPVIVTVEGISFWIIVRGTVDATSHADAQGRRIERQCLQLFASPAVRSEGAYLTPRPYALFGSWLRWPERAAECRMPRKGK